VAWDGTGIEGTNISIYVNRSGNIDFNGAFATLGATLYVGYLSDGTTTSTGTAHFQVSLTGYTLIAQNVPIYVSSSGGLAFYCVFDIGSTSSQGALVNYGLIDTLSAGSVTKCQVPLQLQNHGTVNVKAATSLTFRDQNATSHTDVQQFAGEIDVYSGCTFGCSSDTRSNNISGGDVVTKDVTTTIQWIGNVTLTGATLDESLHPNGNFGKLAITGDLTFASSSTFIVAINAATPSTCNYVTCGALSISTIGTTISQISVNNPGTGTHHFTVLSGSSGPGLLDSFATVTQNGTATWLIMYDTDGHTVYFTDPKA
jgi:hypothetical protein